MCYHGPLWSVLVKDGVTGLGNAWGITVDCSGLLTKGGNMVLGNAWAVTMDYSGLNYST